VRNFESNSAWLLPSTVIRVLYRYELYVHVPLLQMQFKLVKDCKYRYHVEQNHDQHKYYWLIQKRHI